MSVKLSPQQMAIGLILFVPLLLWLAAYHWNAEVENIREANVFHDVFRTADITDTDRAHPELDGKPVHLTGRLETADRLRDSVTGMEENALMLRRSVSYFQWSEIRHSHTRKVYNPSTRRDETETYYTYTYEKRWRDRLISPYTFTEADARKKYKNMQIATCRPYKIFSKNMHIGVYRIPDFLASALEKDAEPLPVRVTENLRSRMEAALRRSLSEREDGAYASVPNGQKLVHVSGNILYYGADPEKPAIGDMRITYSLVRPGSEYSLAATLKGDTFESVKTPKGKETSRLVKGAVSSDKMADEAESSLSWGIGFERTLVIAAYMLWLLILWVLISDYVPTADWFAVVVAVLGGHSLLMLVMGAASLAYEPTWTFGAGMLAGAAGLLAATVLIGMKSSK